MSASILNCPFYLKITAYELKKDKLKELYDDAFLALNELVGNGDNEPKEGGNSTSADSSVSKLLKDGSDLVISRDVATVDDKPIAIFYFPYPNSTFRESFKQAYEENDFNLEETFLNAGLNAVKGNSVTNFIADDLVKISKEAFARAGALVDPNTLNIYKTSLPREISVGWKIIPQNAKQFQFYLEQIERLRNMSKAKREAIGSDSIALRYINIKYTFNIEIVGKYGDTLSNILLCCDKPIVKEGLFLTTFHTNISPQGYQTRHDGSPVSFTLDLTFVERKPLWRADWEKRLGKSQSSQGEEQITADEVNKKSYS